MNIDWKKAKVRCSSIYNIMVSDRKKTNMQLYLDACADIVSKQEKYNKLKKKDGTMGFKYIEDIGKLEAIIPILESQKDVEEPLSVSAKTYLNSLYAFEKYHKWSASKDRGNKYTDKGKEAEANAIQMVSILEGKFYQKHEGRMENEFICGHPDVLDSDEDGKIVKVIDVKAPWDIETFFYNLGRPLVAQYYWQIQGYMALTGAEVGEVHFCLINTPESILNDELYRLFKKIDPVTEMNPEYVQAKNELINNLTFDDMPMEDRRIKFIVEKNEEDIEKVYRRVEKCREWLFEVEKMHIEGNVTENSLSLMETDAQ